MSDAAFREDSRMITMLAFVPLDHLEDVLDSLYLHFSKTHQELRKVLWHFETTYFGKTVEVNGSYVRQGARYQPKTWNKYEAVIQRRPITNNAKEGYYLFDQF